MAARSGDALIFPIGHYLGAFHPARGMALRHYVVRVGWDTPKLPNDAHLEVWSLAHRLLAEVDTASTRPMIAQAARDAGIADAEHIIDTLFGLGLLAEVQSGTDHFVDFARAYRMHALLVGLGNAPDDPAGNAIGLPGLPPILNVRPIEFEIWQWGHLWPSIWSACQGLAQAAREAGDVDPATTQPTQVLASMLGALRTLIAKNAIYLDTATTVRAGS